MGLSSTIRRRNAWRTLPLIIYPIVVAIQTPQDVEEVDYGRPLPLFTARGIDEFKRKYMHLPISEQHLKANEWLIEGKF
tara:strand:+ start:295 stop:531 length:237 start_codon:yes stop_codon:yes gene_type:complete